MSMSNNRAKEPIVYVRKRKTKETEEVVDNIVASSAQQVLERKIDYVSSQLDFADDLRKGKIIRRENNNIMSFGNFSAQRGNQGITIREKSQNSRSEEMAKFFGTSNNHSSGQNLQFQNMNQVSANYFLCNRMKGRSARPRIIVPRAKIIGTSRFSPNYDRNMQRTPESATSDFSFMKLLTKGEESSRLINDQYERQPLSTQYSLSSTGQRVQQFPFSQLGNYHFGNSSAGQMVQQSPFSQLGNYLFDKLSEGQRVEQFPFSQVGNYQFENLSEGQRVKQLPFSQEGNYQFENISEGQRVKQLPFNQVGNYQFEKLSGQRVKQLPSSQVGNSPFDNYLQQDCQNQVLAQPREISFRELLERDDISYMDLLTREDLLISWT